MELAHQTLTMTSIASPANTDTATTVLILNCRSGCALKPGFTDRLLERVRDNNGLHVHRLEAGENPQVVAKQHLDNGAKVIAAAGGDGTISAVANALVGTDAVLVPIPFGTLNHFCKDAGVPLDPIQAIRALDTSLATEKKVDVGEVNGRYFINNSSLGLYPHLVRRREKHQHVFSKWIAYVVAAFEFLSHPVRIRVQLPVEDQGQPFHAGLIFASNNAVSEGMWALGKRERLDEGILQLFVLKDGTVWATFRAAIAFLRGRTQDSDVVNEHRLRRFDVLMKRRKHIRVACDGETFMLPTPIHYKTLPAALTIRVLRPECVEGEYEIPASST
jgi:diacylglycerol kinase family enzyme